MLFNNVILNNDVFITHQTKAMEGLLIELLRVSERASSIARLCRAEKALFELLVEEKVGSDKNKRFAQDFKTLADVLIQETFKYYLGGKVQRLWYHRTFVQLPNFVPVSSPSRLHMWRGGQHLYQPAWGERYGRSLCHPRRH